MNMTLERKMNVMRPPLIAQVNETSQRNSYQVLFRLNRFRFTPKPVRRLWFPGVAAFLVLMSAGANTWAGSTTRDEPDRSQTWCAPAERIYFSCQIGQKTVSLCGSDRITKTEGYLQYRFGRLGKEPELIYPTTQMHPRGQFRDYFDGWPKGYAYEIGFLNGGYNYSIYIYSGALIDGFWGVLVRKEGQPPPSKKLECNGGRTTNFEDQKALSWMYVEAVLERLPTPR